MTFRPRSCAAQLLLCAIFFASVSPSSQCFADLITFEYSGIVEDSVIFGFPDSVPFDAFEGEPIELSFTFDSALVDSNGSANGDYSPIMSAQVMLGSNTYTNTNFGTISIINNGVNPDQYIIKGPVTGPSIIYDDGTYDEMFLNLILNDNTQSVFSTDALPTIQPNPSDFTSAQLRLDFTDSTNFDNFGVVGTNTLVSPGPGDFNGDLIVDGADFLKWQREDGTPASLLEWETNYGNDYALAAVTAAVPEPSGLALFAAGLLGMGYRRQN